MASGGMRHMIPSIARTAVAVGIDGIFMEVSRASQTQNMLLAI